MVEYQTLRGATAEQHGHAVHEFRTIHQEAILNRPLHGVSESCNPAGDDRDLLNGVDARQGHSYQSVAHLMMRYHLAARAD